MKKYIFLLLTIAAFVLYRCTAHKQVIKAQATVSSPVVDMNSPVVSAEESIGKIKLEDGFSIKLVAAEPLVSAPVAMTFDNKGRVWVLQMDDYMPDTLGTGENIPSAKVVILEDKNKDGVMDTRKVFLDSLVMPRAICLIENGILVAEPPYLWHYDIVNDKPVNKTLIDKEYTDGGNVEHQPNGLYRALDNWIYNANSNKRYRKVGNKWLIEKTHSIGQWGISQDNKGRLYANDNSTNLVGDYFSPGLGMNNKDQPGVAGYNERTVADNRVFPLRPTTGVNRGYMQGVLDDSMRLVNFTAACGPLIYRGNLFGKDFDLNAFVAEPAANLIKRDVLHENGNAVKGKEAYLGREFLASVDERFRPVSLYDGPDGALYIVDMYRGIIQHRTYLSNYLKQEIGKRNLTKPLSCGRIYKVYPTNKQPANISFPDNSNKLVALLGNPNGFVRDKAQQLLVDRKAVEVIPALQKALKSKDNPWLVIHALWTLEGLNALKTADVLALLQAPVWTIRMQALSVLPSVIDKNNYSLYTAALTKIVANNDTVAAPYVGFVTNYIQPFDKNAANNLLVSLVKKYPNDLFVADAVVNNLQGREAGFQKEITTIVPDTAMEINKRLQRVIIAIENAKHNSDPKVLAKQFPRGSAIFNTLCKTCHGEDGKGVPSLAPPLNKSEVVNGNKEIMISILLKGLTGPVKINGHVYKAPEISGEMPGFADNQDYTDADIAQILNFVRRSWQNTGDKVNAGDVSNLRKKLAGRQKSFTMEELDPSIEAN
jgi:mono/diheme cytochrome c family protein/glucose/arabinose dehydrogenase